MTPAAGRRGERGQVGGLEAVTFGVLVLVGGTLVLAACWSVLDAKLAAQAAAREAARSWVESDGSPAAWDVAVGRGREAFAGHGRPAGSLTISRSGRHGRCTEATVTATAEVQLGAGPLGRRVPRATVVARHTELVDPYRSGLSATNGAEDRCR